MNAAYFENVSDSALEQVNGGVTVSLSLDSEGVSLEGPLGTVSIPNPFSLIGKAIGGAIGASGDLLSRLGGALTKAGQLFDFG